MIRALLGSIGVWSVASICAVSPLFSSAAIAQEWQPLPENTEPKSVPNGPAPSLSLPEIHSTQDLQQLWQEQVNIPGVSNKPPTLQIQYPAHLEIRLSKRQVALYKGGSEVRTFPIAVGKAGWETPTGTFKVQNMIKNPIWEHPLEKGVVIPGGDPENPLGRHWIGFWTDGKNWIGFHGTPNRKSVGSAASHGCIRMYDEDVAELFKVVTIGTPVTVVQ